MRRAALRLGLPILCALVLAVLVFTLLYRADNKYTHPAAQAISGVLILDDAALENNPVRYLTYEWEYYPGQLLSPAMLDGTNPPLPQRYVYIGQYGGFEADSPAATPHGQASYCLNLLLPAQPATYALLMPEVYSAYRLYVDDALVIELGVPEADAYQDALQARLVTFEAGGHVRLLVAAADHSYFYSGMTHPPAFGTPQAVANVRDAALWLRAAAVAVVLVLALAFLYIGLFARYPKGVLFALLGLCFAGYAGLPLLRAAWPLPLQPLAAISVCCYYLMFLLVLLMQNALYGPRRRVFRLFWVPAVVFCAAVPVYMWLLPVLGAGAMQAFSVLSAIYKVALMAALLVGAVLAVRRDEKLPPLLLGSAAFFALAMVMDRVYPRFEPITTGWFAEVAGFVSVCLLGALLCRDMVTAWRERMHLAEAVRAATQRLEMQAAHSRMVDEQAAALRAVRHDFRQQVLALDGYAEAGDMPGLRAYLASYKESLPDSPPLFYTKHPAANAMARYYAALAEKQGVRFTAQLEMGETAPVSDVDLSVVLGNLLENALRAAAAMPPGAGQVHLAARADDNRLVLRVENSYTGPLQKRRGRFISPRAGGGQGLASVAAVAGRCGGLAQFEAEDGVFVASVVLQKSPL
ncbi:MAG: sensor histidine kinase [Ruminococcaceae bacterium]|nr:sensor histidine kinase [Oscillospiraceae bacterium]